MPATRYYADDFKPGDRHTTRTYAVTEQEIVEFASNYDPQSYHLDAEAARRSQFGGLIASGLQSIALCWKLAQDTGFFEDVVIAGIGLDEIRWHKPVYVGDAVRVEFYLLESTHSRTRADRAISRFRYEMKNQHDDVVVSLIMIQMLRRRPADRVS